VLDLGCGNGALCKELFDAGFQVTGIDPSNSGIEHAQKRVPGGHFTVLGVYDDPDRLESTGFDVVVSTEVVEHLFYPGYLPRFATQVLKPSGYLIISTPYHGYLKNFLLSVFNKWDFHHTPLWDGGHVKFWSNNTLSQLLENEGFKVKKFVGTGRVPFLWKSMILMAQKPR
jgi:2-polyprenyl-3-methyl-5-hydroxy-6-metoxy-1,4-benzoquinol methylase